MRHRFIHEFEDDPKHGDFDVELNLPHGASVHFDVSGGDVNRVGDKVMR